MSDSIRHLLSHSNFRRSFVRTRHSLRLVSLSCTERQRSSFSSNLVCSTTPRSKCLQAEMLVQAANKCYWWNLDRLCTTVRTPSSHNQVKVFACACDLRKLDECLKSDNSVLCVQHAPRVRHWDLQNIWLDFPPKHLKKTLFCTETCAGHGTPFLAQDFEPVPPPPNNYYCSVLHMRHVATGSL